jgi:transcriptional antiterminator
MAKIRERKIREFNQVKYIKDETNKILVNDDDIKNKLIEYFDKLFNEESEQTAIELDNSFDDTNRWFVRRIQESDVKEALKMMKIDKALGHDDIPIEVWRCLEDATIV